MKILFVGGTFDKAEGRKSSLVERFLSELGNFTDEKITVFNGGNYGQLENILESVVNYDIVFWWANVPDNTLPKLRNIKEINPKAMLISSKRNDNKYSFSELVNHALMLKSNLTVEFSKREEKHFNMRVLDPLGNIWYDGINIFECAESVMRRVIFLKSITRQKTNQVSKEKFEIKENEFQNIDEFFKIIKEYAEVFHKKINPADGVKRFLGNASFRCCKGFPSFRHDKYIFVSQRNVDKRYIDKKHFVPTYLEDEKIYYFGDKKPSVDTPIQLRLYQKFPNVNYMVHSHCYIKDASFTSISLPCGAVEEVDEIISTILKEYGTLDLEFYKLNLIGHGCIVMSSDVEKLKDVEFISRPLPEIMY